MDRQGGPLIRKAPGPPPDEATLVDRARGLAGRDLAWIAGGLGVPVPADLRRHKGWVGQLLETALGATAASRAEPDFPHLGVEMKTLPVHDDGRPRQSTYVCTAPLDGRLARTWEESWVRRKLSRVLWVPVLGEGEVGARRVGTPFLWSPDAAEDAALREDWTALTELIALGELWHLTARHGHVLQLRPKGATGADRVWTADESGDAVLETPRGFYLRPAFTGAILRRSLRVRRAGSA